IQVVAQISKQGFTHVLDRRTGQPVCPILNLPVPQAVIPRQRPAPTHPIPTPSPPRTHQVLRSDDLIDFTPELRQNALKIVADFQIGPLYTPPSLPEDNKLGTLQVPSAAGGANWGGAGFDPVTAYLFLQSANQPSYAAMSPGGDEQGQPD